MYAVTWRRVTALLVVNLVVAGAAVATRAGGPDRDLVVSSADDPGPATTTTTTTSVPATTVPAVTVPDTTAPAVTVPPATVPRVTTPPPPPKPNLRDNGLWVVRPDGTGLRKVGERGEGNEVVWSSDGRSLASVLAGDVVVVDVDTGATRTVLDGPPDGNDAATSVSGWSADGSWISYRFGYQGDSIALVSPDGTRRQRVPQELLKGFQVGYWSPTGALLLFGNPMRTYEPATGEIRTIYPDPVDVYGWSADGREILYLQQGIDVIGVDGSNRRTIIRWSPSADETALSPHQFRWSSQNVIALTSIAPKDNAIWTVLPDGSALTRRVSDPIGAPTWSPDGTRLAYVGRNGVREDQRSLDADLYVTSDLGATRQKVVDDVPEMYIQQGPAWSPDGRYIAFTTRRLWG